MYVRSSLFLFLTNFFFNIENALLNHSQDVFVTALLVNPISDNEFSVLLSAQAKVVEASSAITLAVESAQSLFGFEYEICDERCVLDSGHFNGIIGERLNRDA